MKPKSRYIIFMLLLSLHITSTSQPALKESFGTDQDRKRLYYLNTQYIQSWIRSDTATYNRLLWADDFVHQNSADGLLYPKKALLPLFGKPRFDKIEYFYPENVRIQFITDDAAMIFATTPFMGIGQTEEASSQYNDIYVRRNGQWVCVSANVTSITQTAYTSGLLSSIPDPVTPISMYVGTESDVAILKTIGSTRAEAFLRSNAKHAGNILADDFTLLHVNGHLYSKQETLERINSKGKTANELSTYTIKNLTVRFVAPDVAIIHALAIGPLKDGKASGIQHTDIYVKRDGRWLCVSGNSTPVKN